jgi:hypothetical protein
MMIVVVCQVICMLMARSVDLLPCPATVLDTGARVLVKNDEIKTSENIWYPTLLRSEAKNLEI